MQLPITGYPKDAVESKKQAASLPKPPLPSPASVSCSSNSWILIPKSFNPSLTTS